MPATDPAATTPQQIPLHAIDPVALPRDRTGLDPEPLEELRRSIIVSGLRHPVELFPLLAPTRGDNGETHTYGLISGYRRYTVFRDWADAGDTAYAAIPAIVRDLPDRASAYLAMIEENEIRADLSPWERGLAAVTAVDCGFFGNIEEAVDRLYFGATKFKRARIRTVARLADELGDLLVTPETWSQKQLLRLDAALRAGFEAPIHAALGAHRLRTHASQWDAVRRLIEEHEHEAANPPAHPPRPGRPRRFVKLRPALTVRRERTQEGYVLRFSGPEATSALLDEVLDDIDRIYNP